MGVYTGVISWAPKLYESLGSSIDIDLQRNISLPLQREEKKCRSNYAH